MSNRWSIKKVSFNKGMFFVLLCVVLVVFVPEFRRVSNILNIFKQSAVLAVMALGQTLVVILGGIDLSVGAVGALSGALSIGFMNSNGFSPLLAIISALLVGVLIGAINGTLVHVFRLPPFAATLSTMAVARGSTLVYTNGTPIATDAPFFIGLSSSGTLGVSPAVLITALLFCIGFVVLRFTPYGLHIYAVGDSPKVARVSSVPVARVVFSVYIISGFCAALGGVMLASRLWSAQPTAGVGLELQVIAAVVLGGASLFGGVGTVQGTLLGVLMLGVLSNGMNLISIPAYLQRVIQGVILIVAVSFDVQRQKKLKRRKE